MDKSLSVFIAKFKVQEKVKDLIHVILDKEEISILNYLAEREETISSILSEFPSSGISLIESLYKRGYLTKRSKEGEDHYKSNPFDQILKRFVNHSSRYQELSDEEKIPFQESVTGLYLERMRASDKPVYRVIPVEKTIQDKRQLIPYYQALHYIKEASALAFIDCICRTTHQKCDKPREVCLSLGDQAKFFVERGLGEEIDIQKGLEILNIAEKNGLVHSINNKESPNFLCNCCECCCVFVQGLKKYGIYTSIGKSGFIASLDSDLCDQCGICLEKCIFEAISNEEDNVEFEKDKCFGCGLCAYNCPQSAIKLILIEPDK
jgi:Pyruvate/2-oxoacid:ferredoxin oxidoreductase delta subunit